MAGLRDRNEMTERDIIIDRISGCLFGGALGDALGLPVEFLRASVIKRRFGDEGIDAPLVSEEDGTYHISDDTQMSLFTRQALNEISRAEKNGEKDHPDVHYILDSYLGWLYTQTHDYDDYLIDPSEAHSSSWLLNEKRLFNRRAPGYTCLTSLEQIKREGSDADDYIAIERNDSKGCGGVMRAAPVGLYRRATNLDELKRIDKLAAQSSAITHSHPLGWMTSAMLAHMINSIVFPFRDMTLEEIVKESLDTVLEMFPDVDEDYREDLREIIELAMELAKNDKKDLENLEWIGEGWVAEETLAIAVYCLLKYRDDPEKAIQVSVNHDGDSDSTGAVTGNLVGAYNGVSGLPVEWIVDLELSDVIASLAKEMCEFVI